MSILADQYDVVIGVDTHKHTHTAVAIDAATAVEQQSWTVSATPAGYADLLGSVSCLGSMRRCWAIEGCGSWGKGLARWLATHGEHVIEVERPKRPARHNGAKSDAIDALRASPRGARLAPPRWTSMRSRARCTRGVGLRPPFRPRRRNRRGTSTARFRDHGTRVTQRQAATAVHEAHRQRMLLVAARRSRRCRCRRHRRRDEGCRRPRSSTARRSCPPRRTHPSPHHRLAPRSAGDRRGRPDHRRRRAVRLVASRPPPQRISLRHARRNRAHPRLLRADQPPPPQPWRRSSTQLGHPHDLRWPDRSRPAHPGLPRSSPRRGQDHQGDPTLHQALHRSRALPRPRIRA